MGEGFNEHIAWLRFHDDCAGWSKWCKRGRFNTRMDAESSIEEYCSKHPESSGVALPLGVRPIERTRKESS